MKGISKMKTSTKMTSAALAVMTLGSAAFSTGAFADAQKQKNNWRNIGAGAAAVGLYGVKNHDTLITILGAAGAAYSAQQYEKNRKAEDAAARQHQQNYYRRYHRYDSPHQAAVSQPILIAPTRDLTVTQPETT